MAFDIKGLKRFDIGGSVGSGEGSIKALYHYATNDAAGVVETTGYFNSLVGQVSVGDVVFASLDLDGTPALKNYIVSAVTASVVTIAAQVTS